MSNVISVKSTVAQAEGFSVEVVDSTLLSARYFPTTPGDEFAGKEVLFDFDSSDLEKGAFLTQGYKDGNVSKWTSNSVIPPRVGSQDTVDPTDQDRVIFERLCRAQGADLNRAEAYQNLLNLKSARLAKRTDRAKELLASLVLKEGKIDFDQARDVLSEDTDHIVCKFYNPEKGACNHFVPAVKWSDENAHPYADICTMVNEGMKHGRRYTDLVLGTNAWVHLSHDADFKAFAGNTYHSDGMKLTFGDVDGATHVATAVFSGVQLNVIVYSGAYKTSEGVLKQYIDASAAIVISEGIGRGLQGGCTLLNPDSLGYGLENSFVGMTGVHMQSIFKDFDKQKLCIREESRPLPTPKHAVDEMDWIYCDTELNVENSAFGEVYTGVVFNHDAELTWASTCSSDAGVVMANSDVNVKLGTVAGKTVKLYAVREGVPSEVLDVAESKLIIPVDNDKDESGKAIIFATAV